VEAETEYCGQYALKDLLEWPALRLVRRRRKRVKLAEEPNILTTRTYSRGKSVYAITTVMTYTLWNVLFQRAFPPLYIQEERRNKPSLLASSLISEEKRPSSPTSKQILSMLNERLCVPADFVEAARPREARSSKSTFLCTFAIQSARREPRVSVIAYVVFVVV